MFRNFQTVSKICFFFRIGVWLQCLALVVVSPIGCVLCVGFVNKLLTSSPLETLVSLEKGFDLIHVVWADAQVEHIYHSISFLEDFE